MRPPIKRDARAAELLENPPRDSYSMAQMATLAGVANVPAAEFEAFIKEHGLREGRDADYWEVVNANGRSSWNFSLEAGRAARERYERLRQPKQVRQGTRAHHLSNILHSTDEMLGLVGIIAAIKKVDVDLPELEDLPSTPTAADYMKAIRARIDSALDALGQVKDSIE